MSLRIVADSACDVPARVAVELGITVVPVYINIGEQSYLDGVDLSREEFFANLPQYDVFPTTAAPASGTFTNAYQRLIDDGATEILSLHIAANLSNTYNAARLGAEDVQGGRVTLWDTRQITMGSGLQVMAAATAAAGGQSLAEILALLEAMRPKTRIIAVLDTLEFLRRSGRVSWAQFGLGTLLRIKPMIGVAEGEVAILERVRTFKRALGRLVEIMAEQGPLERIAVLHAGNLPTAKKLWEQAEALFPSAEEPIFMEITPAIGSHIGPGAVGFAFTTA